MGERSIYTEFGPVAVDEAMLRLWNKYGWPEESVLERMATEQRVARVVEMANLAGGENGDK